MNKLLQLGILLLISQGALAKPVGAAAADCSSLLVAEAPELEYALSDLEGSFFDLVQKVQEFPESDPARHEFLIKDILSMKAAVLNQVIGVLPVVVQSAKDNPKRARVLASIYRIVSALGIPPSMYGLELDKQNRVALMEIPKAKKSTAPDASADAAATALKPAPRAAIGFIPPTSTPETEAAGKVQNAIGFTAPRSPATRDLPEGFNRSIGFAPHEIRAHAPPAREAGLIKTARHPQNKDILVIADGTDQRIYQIFSSIISSVGAEAGGKRMRIDFIQNRMEWVVIVENLNNPSGKMGFL